MPVPILRSYVSTVIVGAEVIDLRQKTEHGSRVDGEDIKAASICLCFNGNWCTSMKFDAIVIESAPEYRLAQFLSATLQGIASIDEDLVPLSTSPDSAMFFSD
jgi:hypothetical protein